MTEAREHWEDVWTAKDPRQTSWFEATPTWSLARVRRWQPDRRGRVVDAGGGASLLVDALLDDGYEDVVVLDVSRAALDVARGRLGDRASQVAWVVGDVVEADLDGPVDLWHDRAVLHFLRAPDRRRAYADRLAQRVRPGGHAVIAGFGPDGPTHCSGLEVHRASADDLAELFADDFEVVETDAFEHRTPWDAPQAFAAVVLERR